jgi:ParB family transcriptional regulator, chromosome partitioning protein
VEETRALVMAKTKSLNETIFDKTECGTCPHNSSKQQSMFANIDGGHCMNAVCFDAKVEGKLQEIANGLKDDFNRVEIFRPGDNFKLAKIDVTKLGETQVATCRNCKDCGAAVSAMPNKLGLVSKNLCYGTTCFEEHVTAFTAETKAAEKAQADAAAAAAAASEAGNDADPESPDSTPVKAEAKKTTEGAAAAEKTIQPVSLTNALHEFRDAFYRRVIAIEYAINPAFASSFVFALVLSNKGSYFDGHALQESLHKANLITSTSKLHSLKEAMQTTVSIGKDIVDKKLPLLGALAMTKLERSELKDMMLLSQADLAKHFKLNSEAGIAFLKVLTKDQIASICDELGIKKAMGQTFNSIANGKKDDFIKHVTSVADFPYEGKVPKALQPAFGK